MPTAIDDLKPGMWVAVCGLKDEPPASPFEFPFFLQPAQARFDGVPLQVLAVSLPFICVSRHGKTLSIDVRQWSVQRVNRKYVNALLSNQQSPVGQRKKRRNREKPDPKACPRCGTRMVERRIISANPARHSWFIVCSVCGFDAGHVST